MDALIDLSSKNFSYYTIPAAFALCLLPGFYAVSLAGKNYDLANPRNLLETCSKDTSLAQNKPLLNQINRAKAAQANGFETLGLYAAAVVAANSAGLAKADLVKLNTLTIGYVISRTIYNFIYIHLQNNRRLAGLRPLAWGVGIYIIVSLFLSAGKLLNA
ncbi:hypothetical protein QBC38DRAFT_514550 [Podospora fimiseda]|uniref:MAPEG family protein n=1 Tax=Podospora fimiseda TaxID=252190 RepID=A0AAN7BX28_9PEZI|nr:hypothetical protein QBC38DRAFT_514550 [Podospora fimiseda]